MAECDPLTGSLLVEASTEGPMQNPLLRRRPDRAVEVRWPVGLMNASIRPRQHGDDGCLFQLYPHSHCYRHLRLNRGRLKAITALIADPVMPYASRIDVFCPASHVEPFATVGAGHLAFWAKDRKHGRTHTRLHGLPLYNGTQRCPHRARRSSSDIDLYRWSPRAIPYDFAQHRCAALLDPERVGLGVRIRRGVPDATDQRSSGFHNWIPNIIVSRGPSITALHDTCNRQVPQKSHSVTKLTL
jgi:hypothetical protein